MTLWWFQCNGAIHLGLGNENFNSDRIDSAVQ